MNSMTRSMVQRAVAAACSRRGISTRMQRGARAQLRAPRDEARQKVCHQHAGEMSLGSSIRLGVLVGMLYHLFKPPEKTCNEIWMEICSSKGAPPKGRD